MRRIMVVVIAIAGCLAIGASRARAQENPGDGATQCKNCQGHSTSDSVWTQCGNTTSGFQGNKDCIDSNAGHRDNVCSVEGFATCTATEPEALLADGTTSRAMLLRVSLERGTTVRLTTQRVDAAGSLIVKACNGSVVDRAYSAALGDALRTGVRVISL